MQKADLFAYIAAFISIMLAIALSDMVQSVHRLLRDRARVRWDVLTPLLAVWVFMWVTSEFFSMVFDAGYNRLTFYGMMGLLVVPTITSLLAFAVLPDEVPEQGLDLEKFYFANLSYFVVLLTAIQLADIGRVVAFAWHYDGFARIEAWYSIFAMWIAYFLFLGLMYFVRERWAQLVALIVLLLLGHFGFGWGFVEAKPDV